MFKSGIGALLVLLIAAGWTAGQDLEERLRKAEEELALLREQVAAQNRDTTPSAAEQSDLDAAINRALDDRLRTNFMGGKLTASGSPIRFYGFVRLDAYYNSARANSAIIPAFVLPENKIAADDNDDEFAFDVRLTRLGLDIAAGEIIGAEVTGKIEADFAGFTSTSESRADPRIRLAYINMDFGSYWMRFGQDWDIISPLYPSVNAELLMWNAGNLGDRRPGAKIGFTAGSGESTEFGVVAGLMMSDAVGNTDLDAAIVPPAYASTVRDGFDSGLPMIQARAHVKAAGIEIGLWGHVASYETDNSFPIGLGGTKHFRGQSLGVDVNFQITDAVSLLGEAWVGQNLADVRGGIGQGVNVIKGREIESAGGWAEVRLQLTDVFRLSLGGTLDDPRNDDVVPGGATKNFTFYAATVQDWGGGFRTGFDVIFWETDWKNGGAFVTGGVGNMVRVNAYTMLSF